MRPTIRPTPSSLSLLLVLSTALAGCARRDTVRPDGPPPAPVFDVEEWLAPLKADQRTRVQEALEAFKCDCDPAKSAAACLRARPQCPAAVTAVKLAKGLAQMGAKPPQITKELEEYFATFSAPRAQPELAGVPCEGPSGAAVTLVVFSDFQCPACSRFVSTGAALRKRFPNEVRICFKHFPLKQHTDALTAAQAAEFAHAHGKFWPMHDQLFFGPLELEDLRKKAKEVGLTPDDMERAIWENTYLERVRASVAEGKRLGVDATPFVFVNGRRSTLPPLEGLLGSVVEDELSRGRHGTISPAPSPAAPPAVSAPAPAATPAPSAAPASPSAAPVAPTPSPAAPAPAAPSRSGNPSL